eukprot:474717_1
MQQQQAGEQPGGDALKRILNILATRVLPAIIKKDGTMHVIHLVLPPEHDNLAREAGGQAYGAGQSQPVRGMTVRHGAAPGHVTYRFQTPPGGQGTLRPTVHGTPMRAVAFGPSQVQAQPQQAQPQQAQQMAMIQQLQAAARAQAMQQAAQRCGGQPGGGGQRMQVIRVHTPAGQPQQQHGGQSEEESDSDEEEEARPKTRAKVILKYSPPLEVDPQRPAQGKRPGPYVVYVAQQGGGAGGAPGPQQAPQLRPGQGGQMHINAQCSAGPAQSGSGGPGRDGAGSGGPCQRQAMVSHMPQRGMPYQPQAGQRVAIMPSGQVVMIRGAPQQADGPAGMPQQANGPAGAQRVMVMQPRGAPYQAPANGPQGGPTVVQMMSGHPPQGEMGGTGTGGSVAEDHAGNQVIDSMPHRNGRILVLRNGHVLTPPGMQPSQLKILPQMSRLIHPAALPAFNATGPDPTGHATGMMRLREQTPASTRYFKRIATAPGATGCVRLPVSVAALPPDQLASLLRGLYGLYLQQGTPHTIVHTAPSVAQTPIAGRISGVSGQAEQPARILVVRPTPPANVESADAAPQPLHIFSVPDHQITDAHVMLTDPTTHKVLTSPLEPFPFNSLPIGIEAHVLETSPDGSFILNPSDLQPVRRRIDAEYEWEVIDEHVADPDGWKYLGAHAARMEALRLEDIESDSQEITEPVVATDLESVQHAEASEDFESVSEDFESDSEDIESDSEADLESEDIDSDSEDIESDSEEITEPVVATDLESVQHAEASEDFESVSEDFESDSEDIESDS